MSSEGAARDGKVTIRTVAEDAGVSVAAVSKVLRNAYGVSDAMREKVQESIARLGYRPSTAARGMRGRTFSIGVLLVEMRNPFLPSLMDGAKEVLREASYQAFISVGEARAAIERSLIDSMIDLQMDGVILVAPRLSGELLARYAKQIPMVVIGHHEPGAEAFDTVNSDDRTGARMAVESLIAGGREDIQMASLPRKNGEFDVYVERERGYYEAMEAAGLGDRAKVWPLREQPERPGPALTGLLDLDPLPEGIFCWSDIHAVRLLNEAKMRGIDVPGRLGIVGYDNTPAAGLPLVGLTSVDQRGEEIGRLAADVLLSRIGGRQVPEHILVTPKLVTRGSS
ncbi:LacI family DNA-binding transcriptional regulator [Histidinibacterium aquaticum]|uniref:LacI family transcriptional regulator n=1 Tax=Histidinibacterium aquaticum TaxID=2613962 RepID=A0A5J5GLG6_9RHOB|nr:LacI family DNA-binding transcriptional regulator [Histidinibacterium aquaticum]KAA9008867.1 LacI family transcriptional regulator [Histidinibacterium aquaticum]